MGYSYITFSTILCREALLQYQIFNIAVQGANYNFIKKYWLNLDIEHKNIYEIQYEDLVGDSKNIQKKFMIILASITP